LEAMVCFESLFVLDGGGRVLDGVAGVLDGVAGSVEGRVGIGRRVGSCIDVGRRGVLNRGLVRRIVVGIVLGARGDAERKDRNGHDRKLLHESFTPSKNAPGVGMPGPAAASRQARGAAIAIISTGAQGIISKGRIDHIKISLYPYAMTLTMPLADRFQALADPTRLRIVALLRLMELSVGELAQVLGQSQPRGARHLKILADQGVLERRKEGSWVFLTLTDPARVEPMFALIDAWADPPTEAWFATDAARTEAIRAERAEAASSY